jgi:hypothetical protein
MSEYVALRLSSPEAVVTWFVTCSRTSSLRMLQDLLPSKYRIVGPVAPKARHDNCAMTGEPGAVTRSRRAGPAAAGQGPSVTRAVSAWPSVAAQLDMTFSASRDGERAGGCRRPSSDLRRLPVPSSRNSR